MSAVLRACGHDFDVDAFLAECTLPVCAIKRRGELISSTGELGGRRHETSGIHIVASDAEMDQFRQQQIEATEFLQSNRDELCWLCEWPGVESVVLDFGIQQRVVFVQCDSLSPELIQAAGLLGLGIELSHYPVSETDLDAEVTTTDIQ